MDWKAVSLHYRAMKPINAHFSIALALSFSLAACVPAASPPPVVTPAPTPAPRPSPTPAPPPVVQQPVHENWLDVPQTPGDWRYERTALGGAASFGANPSAPSFVLSCDRTRGQVQLRRPGTASGQLSARVLTETTTRMLTAAPDQAGSPWIVITLGARDPLLDAMAVTKGRFAVETESMPSLYLPSWTEVTRVIEDCR